MKTVTISDLKNMLLKLNTLKEQKFCNNDNFILLIDHNNGHDMFALALSSHHYFSSYTNKTCEEMYYILSVLYEQYQKITI